MKEKKLCVTHEVPVQRKNKSNSSCSLQHPPITFIEQLTIKIIA